MTSASTALSAAHRAGLWLAVAGAIAFSGKAIIVKLAYRYPVDAATLIMYRMLFALPLFLLMAWWAERQPLARAQPLTRKDVLGIIGLGFMGYYLSSYLDFLGLQYVSAGLERLILYLNPTLVVLAGCWLHRKPLGRSQVAGMVVSYVGVVVVFGHEVGLQGANAVLGSLLVFGCAVSYSFYLVFSGQMVQRLGSLRLVGLATSVACVLCILHFLLTRPIDVALHVAPAVVWLSLLNAIACTAVPVLLVMMAIERIGSGMTAQTGLVGPLSTVLMGVWILDEHFTAWVAAGTVLVIAGIWLFTRDAGRAAPQSAK